MPFKIERNDITLMRVDAIVNAANESLLGGGGVDGAIHAAAGPRLLDECRMLGGCKTGEAKLTGGWNLPAKYIIHTVGPVWGKSPDDSALLRSCYRNSLALAQKHGFESVAFPLISAGAYGCPKEIAFGIARDEILRFLRETDSEMNVTLVIFDADSARVSESEIGKLESYISDNYVIEKERRFGRRRLHSFNIPEKPAVYDEMCDASFSIPIQANKAKKDGGLPEFTVDESFSQMLLRLIDEKGMKDSECYFKANKDRKLFSKIRSNVNYKPGKETAIAFAIALELNLPETLEFIGKAGYTLSDSILSDVIIKFCIKEKKYNIFDINMLLFQMDQKLL